MSEVNDEIRGLVAEVKTLLTRHLNDTDGEFHPLLLLLRDRNPIGSVLIRAYEDEVDKKAAFTEASLAIRLANADEVTFTYAVETDDGPAVRLMGVSLVRAFLALLPYTVGEGFTGFADTDPEPSELHDFDKYMVSTLLAALHNTSPSPILFPLITDLLHRRGHRISLDVEPSGGELLLGTT